MPNRILRSKRLTSRTIASLSAEGERHYVRLLLIADDFGRFEADTEVLRGRLYPMLQDQLTNELVDSWTRSLVDAGLIQIYRPENEDRKYGYFVKWLKYNKLRTKNSLYPDPIGSHTCDDTCEHMSPHVNTRSHMSVYTESESDSESNTDSESESDTPLLRNGSDPRASVVPQSYQGWKDQLFKNTNRRDQVALLVDMCRSLTQKPIDGGRVASLVNDRNGDVERVMADLWHSIADNPDGDLVLYTKGKARSSRPKDDRVPATAIFRRTADP